MRIFFSRHCCTCILLLLLILNSFRTASQEHYFYTEQADTILQNLNKSYITTGILYDRAFPMSRFDAFNPLIDTSDYDFATQAYYELYQAHYNRSVLLDPGLLMNIVKWENMRGRAPILILDYQYNILDTMAIDNNLLSLQSGYLYDVAGRPRSPYLLQRFQLATPLTDTLYTNSVQFCALPIFTSRNTGLDVQRIVADFGDGTGQHTLNGPLDSITINYPSNGEKIMTLQVTLSDGSSFSTKNRIVLQSNSNFRVMGTDASDPCYSEYITADMAYQGLDDAIPYKGSFQINYYYRTNDGTTCFSGKKNIKKPIILIDGFDPTDKRDAKKLYEQFLFYMDDVNFPNNPQKVDLVTELRSQGYDVILVDIPSYVIWGGGQYIQRPPNSTNFPNGWPYYYGKVIRGGGDYVQRNAFTLVKLINQLNQELASQGSTEKLVIVGPSMGGQISRYALRWMELNGQNHNCCLWVSFDSNHEGAVLPIGEQYFVDYMAGASAGAWRAREWQINVPAAKQFLIDHYLYHANGDINPGGAPNYFDAYYNEINTMGWPQQVTRKISMISGAENGQAQNTPSGGQLAYQHLLKNNRFIKRILFIKLNNDITMLDANIYVAPAPSQGTKIVFESHVNTLTTILNGLHYRIKYSNPSPLCRNQSLEAVQGGFYWGYNELEESSGGNNTVVKGTGRSVRQFINNYAHFHTHIPTFSSLAIGKGPNPITTRKWDDNINEVNLVCPTQKEIPFDAYYGPGTLNVRHDSLFYWQAKYLIDEIKEIPMPGKTIQGRTISGSSIACTNRPNYYSINLPPSGSVVWNASPSGKVSLTPAGPNGVLATPINSPSGSYTLIATVTAPCISTSAQLVVNFATPPPYTCLQIGNGNCLQYIYKCTEQFYTAIQLDIPNHPSDVAYWHWTVQGGHFNGGSTSIIVPYVPIYVTPDQPNIACSVTISPMNECMVESTNEPFRYVLVNTGQHCYGYYVMSPNPATNDVTISTIEKSSETQIDRSITSVNIYDQQGIMRKQKKFGKVKTASMFIGDLTDGMYVVEIVSGDYKEQKQLLVKH